MEFNKRAFAILILLFLISRGQVAACRITILSTSILFGKRKQVWLLYVLTSVAPLFWCPSRRADSNTQFTSRFCQNRITLRYHASLLAVSARVQKICFHIHHRSDMGSNTAQTTWHRSNTTHHSSSGLHYFLLFTKIQHQYFQCEHQI